MLGLNFFATRGRRAGDEITRRAVKGPAGAWAAGAAGLLLLLAALPPLPAMAQEQAAAGDAAEASGEGETAAQPLTGEELEILVARIALYPDELVSAIAAASLYPLQIVEAQRYLDTAKPGDKQEPKATWDGSVISLLNYPTVVKMMSDDLDWTQTFGEAISYQEKDVLAKVD